VEFDDSGNVPPAHGRTERRGPAPSALRSGGAGRGEEALFDRATRMNLKIDGPSLRLSPRSSIRGGRETRSALADHARVTHRPQGIAALSRSPLDKPPALPEVADFAQNSLCLIQCLFAGAIRIYQICADYRRRLHIWLIRSSQLLSSRMHSLLVR
jgi:hypothetical protein